MLGVKDFGRAPMAWSIRPGFRGDLVLCDEDGDGRLQHPLSPQVREWSLSPLKIKELITLPTESETKPKKKAKAKEPQEETLEE